MGLLTKEDLSKTHVKWVSIDQESGEFSLDNQTYPAISGKLLGFDKHAYTFRNSNQEKFDIFIGDDNVYQVQLGLYSWTTWRLLNQIVSKIDNINGHNNIILRAGKDDNGNFTMFAVLDGAPLKWKYKWAEAFGDIKDRSKIEEKRNKFIDKWANALIEKKKFSPQMPTNEETEDIPF